jgi:predicted ATPase/DNA-binding CsgD family transcriptional regulator
MARSAPKTRLPAPAASLIGREREVADVAGLLRSGATRLVTLTGPGGVGKTRLGVEVARGILDDFPDGACFVSLASVTDHRLLASTIGQALGLREAGEKRVLERVAAYMQERQMLLLLDSFEQLLEASPVVSDLLAACSGLTVLVTSRAALHISGEHEFPVPPLALPDPKNLPAGDTLLQYPAVALFAVRARALDPDFAVNQDNAAAVAEICARVEGLPLALELAAGRLRLLSPQAMLARLERRLELLTGGPRDLPARQQTLRGAIKWSYDLLDANEKRMFRTLGAFAGGCTLEAAGGVCDRAGTFSGEVLDTVESLVDKSVVNRVEPESGEGRVTMLDTIREYALERLVKSGEANVMRRAHCLYYLAFAEQVEAKLRGEEQGSCLDQLESEHDNLRAALSWSLDSGETELALRLGAALWRFWYVRGYLSEGRGWLDAAIGVGSANPGRARARALTGAAVLAHYQGDYVRAATLAEEALSLSRRLRDKQGVAASLDALALVARSSGRYGESRDMCEKSLAIFRELGDRWHIGRSLAHLSIAARLEAHYDEARVASEEALTVLRELGDAEGTAYALNALGGAALAQGSHAQARSLQEEALAMMRSAGDRRGVTRVLHAFGLIALREGDCATARALLERTIGLVAQFGDRLFMSISVDGLAGVAVVEGKAEEAARLLGAADSLREAVGVVLPPAYRPDQEAVETGCRSRLGDERFAAARAEGQAMSEEQIVSLWGREEGPEDLGLVGEPEVDSHPDDLTAREVEVLRLVAEGLTDVEVAERLVVSPRTVHSHLRSIYRKLDVTTRSAATRYAIDHSLV